MFLISEKIAQLRRFFTAKIIFITLGLIVLYFVTRFIHIKGLPLFTDEGIYINWAKIAWHDGTWRFISLTDGKQPLQTWMTIPLLKIFPHDAVVAGRLFGVLSGFTALCGLMTISTYLWGRKAGGIAGILYIFTPYFLFYDRMALVDSAVNSAFIWIVFFSILLVRTKRLDISLIFGLVAGFALLAKSSVLLFLGMSVFAPVTEFFHDHKKSTSSHTHLISALLYWVLLAISALIAFVIYSIQRLSPFYHVIAEKNKTFILTPQEFIQHPFQLFFSNLVHIPVEVVWEAGFGLLIFSILGAIALYKRDKGLFTFLFLLFLIPFLAICSFNKIAFPRYLIFFCTLMVLFATYWFAKLSESIRSAKYAVVGLIMTQLIFDFFILFDVKNALLPPIDRGQYIMSENATWGAEQLMKDMKEKAATKPVMLVAEGDFGLIGDVLRAYSYPEDNIDIRGVWPLPPENIASLEQEASQKGEQVYIVTAHRDSIPELNDRLFKKYPHPVGKKAISVFTLE
jgi:4-amino-4-deoxy-L-arabinose transferase-like glycosyltransferase